ncbi:hypothetical protein AM588_10011069 [Phytophthora nicotianae]|uniref:Micro-fibrillar-associated protein 1 C-terminal domain-containing protein n=1 Tax=Phytophthora nicotianae TaxID=4792 RepID=A0A0W8DFC5_PHYNI|nr:hypothetical protein AM588_10011069 [Phytophthora nicotianae]
MCATFPYICTISEHVALHQEGLGLLLPDDTPGDPLSLRHTNTKEETEEFKPLKPKVDPSKKVARYRAGQVPKFAHGYEEDRGFVTANSKVRALPKVEAQHKPTPVINAGRKRVEAQVISAIKPAAKDRGRREQASSSSEDEKESSDDDVAKALQDSSSEEEDESDIDCRRRMLRNKAKAREAQKEEDAQFAVPEKKSVRQLVEPQIVKRSAVAIPAEKAKNGESESGSSGSSSSEYETDTDDSEPVEELMKPVFVPKKARGTVKRQEELAAEEERRQKREHEKMEARKMESRRLVAEEEQRRKEEEETQRRRNMTEEERAAEDAKLKKNEPKEKNKLKFMQKYYHKGAFYVDDDSIRSKDDVRKRDATEATLEDKFNKEMLPAVMQVKNFGRAGRTKYTHLADQDTSSRDSLWARNDGIREKYKSHLSGMKNIDGSTKRRRKE